MKIVRQDEINFKQSIGRSSKEQYSMSGMVSTLLGSRQLFIHQDIISPGKRSSAPHRHTVIEEIVHVLKGSVTVVCGDVEQETGAGSFVFLDPKDEKLHYLVNKSSEDVVTITYSIDSNEDQTIF